MINFRSSKLKNNIISVQQQPNGIDCGRFEIIQKGMEKCEKNTCFFLKWGLFPLFLRAGAEASKRSSFTYNLDVYRTCWNIYFEEDIEKDKGYFTAQYYSCDDQFHRKCLLVSDEIFLDDQKHTSLDTALVVSK